ncbi:MAG: DoxX family membrane protein [Patescibacteria group bacterium]|nr:MAG: DoxX family membrane protein [Patescibacteria group bacterium]
MLEKIIKKLNFSHYEKAARVGLALIYIWFGALKIFGVSPAEGAVEELFYATINIMDFNLFLILYGFFEVIIGILFLIPKMTKFVTYLFIIHIITTTGPLVLLPKSAWDAPLVPSFFGQYIIKNIILVITFLGVLINQNSRK